VIRVVGGKEGSPELEAARDLAERIESEWAGLAPSPEITIVAGIQCHGQRVRDLDLVVLVWSGQEIVLEPLLPLRLSSGEAFESRRLCIRGLCLAIEVKDHPASALRFEGPQAYVAYRNRWHNATAQSEDQQVSLRNFLKSRGVAPPFVTNLLWLRGLRQNQLPPRPHNFLGGNATWEVFVNVAAQLSGHPKRGDWVVDAFAKGAAAGDVQRVLAARVEPGALDRMRMERICAQLLPKDLADAMGSRLLLLRGRGGTGKTMALLQLAWQAYRERGDRCLVLTYNRVLAADLNRLLALLHVPDDVAGESIQVKTIVGYLSRLLERLGFPVMGSDFDAAYEAAKEAAIQYLDQDALTGADIEALRSDYANDYDFDLVFVDEGQDWPNDEIRVLTTLFPRSAMTVADGVDQFVRSGRPDWRKGLTRGDHETSFFSQSLRMKSGLTRFANRVASQLGLTDWSLDASGELVGGRVEIVIGNYLDLELGQSLLAESRQAGNKPIDNLFCVPPSDVYLDNTGERCSRTGDRLREQGFEIWNGVSPTERLSAPCSAEVFRVVQYESSRGAEGWLVVAFALDQFCDQKARSWRPTDDHSLVDPELSRQLFLARWIMIALSRALDTLVIELSRDDHWLSRILLTVAAELPDIVGVHKESPMT
jgi:hypothetical protein